MKKELDTLMKSSPNIWGNSIGMFLIRILAWVSAILCFAAGIYFLTLSTTNDSDKSFFEGLYYQDSNPIFAAFCLLLSLLLFFIVRMGRMLLVRNSFILDVKEWNYKFKKLEMRESEIALKLLEMGNSNNDISLATGLSIEEIESLKRGE